MSQENEVQKIRKFMECQKIAAEHGLEIHASHDHISFVKDGLFSQSLMTVEAMSGWLGGYVDLLAIVSKSR